MDVWGPGEDVGQGVFSAVGCLPVAPSHNIQGKDKETPTVLFSTEDTTILITSEMKA